MNRLLTILAIALLTATAWGRTRTTQNQLRTDAIVVDALPATALDTIEGVHAGDVTLRGFSKRASDGKESFFVTNNTTRRMSAVRLLLRYSMLDGSMLHEREVTVPVSLAPGQTQLVSVTTFDTQRAFYYHAGPRPRKSATPFKVAFRLLGYDVPVGR